MWNWEGGWLILAELFAHLSSRSGELLVLFDYDTGSVRWGEADLVLHLQVICDQVWLNEMCPQREKEPFHQRQLSKDGDMVHARNRKSTDCIIYLGKQGIVHCDKISQMQRVKRWKFITLISISAQLQGGRENLAEWYLRVLFVQEEELCIVDLSVSAGRGGWCSSQGLKWNWSFHWHPGSTNVTQDMSAALRVCKVP